MGRIEFYIYEDELWCKTSDGKNYAVDESNTDVVSYILNKVRVCYPKAYAALEKCYSKSSANARYYQYLMARRFCKCNFSPLDPTSYDMDSQSERVNFEKVPCPLRGECSYEGCICSPQFDRNLSKAELRVMRLLYDGMNKEEIGEALYVSPGTVKNQIKSAYLKLGVHSRAEFVKYANDHNMFNQ